MQEIQEQAIVPASGAEEKKYHKIPPEKKPLIIGVALFVLLIVLPALILVYYNIALNRPAQIDKEKVFRIDKGEDAMVIGHRLYDEDLINSKALFNFYVISNGLHAKIQAGTYTIPAGYSVKQLLELFQSGKNDIRITFLEGWRVEEMALEASDKLKSVGYNTFVDLAKPYEGTLFPDTYDFNLDATEEEIINTMRSNFDTRTEGLITDASSAKTGLTESQTIILASIVEREVSNKEDRRIVAGILLKRFKEETLLGADATAQYAVGTSASWWPVLTADNLDSPSPYNTRKIAGLPPAPICNPGLDSLQAVLEFQPTEYYYYLTDPQGVTHYAKTLAEHNINVAKYLLR